jgi:hypothetical protein
MTNKLELRFLLVLLILSVNLIPLFSQSINYIKGKIVDSETAKPLSFASVGLKHNHIGVFANADGDFKIIQDPRFITDSLVVSCIGYKRKAISFEDLKLSEVNNIFLTPVIYSLNEVKVIASRKKLDPLIIIEKAIKNIKKNYSREQFSYVSYYRDYQKRNNNYVNLDEAIIQVTDNGFDRKSVLNKYRLLDFKQNLEFQRMNISPYYDTISTPYFDNKNKFIQSATLPNQGGNEFFILMVHDAIRNFNTASFSFVNIFSKDFLANHIFSDVVPIFNNDLLLYKIDFKAKQWLTGDSILIYGSIYIQPKEYSIHKLEYSGAYLFKGKEKKDMFNIKIEYGHENTADALMYLKYISFNNIFNVIDTTDNTYFRIMDSYSIDSTRNPIYFKFNYNVDSLSAINKSCYRIVLDDKEAKITNISVEDNKVVVTLKNDKKNKKKIEKCFVYAHDIKDVYGRILNERKYLEFYQYRELFIQEYNKLSTIEDSCYLRDKPLIQNCISKDQNKDKYWMNTPINPKTNKQ